MEARFIIDRLNKEVLKGIPHQKDLVGRVVIDVKDAIRCGGYVGNIAKILNGAYNKIVVYNVN